MVDIEIARQIAMALPGTEEKDHFGMPSFRVSNKIFSTLWVKENRMMVKLSPIEQSVFNTFDAAIFYPVPNKWGLKGATFVELSKVRRDMLKDALSLAWQALAPKNNNS
ncbi:MAG: MmcQ/YjbR family DNA-binding protein [Bacteroidota bacterium]|nr:MmcQ/YjbR family DNA-binding protein [Bacteroidota bacterium]